MPGRSSPTRFAWLSVGAAVATMGLKAAAWMHTGSIGVLSDAVESLVNLAGALLALAMLSVAARPPDEDHAYGHTKAEYFSSVVEGTLILAAALGIAAAAVSRLIHPSPIGRIGTGAALVAAAAAVNLIAAAFIRRGARRHHSITLDANADHLLADVWTSAAVLAGVGAVALTGWEPLDPIVALLVAVNVVRTGIRIVNASVSGLMDSALPAEDQTTLAAVLARHEPAGASFHAVRTRQSGLRRFVSMHVLVPGDWTVHHGHQLLERIEADIRAALPHTTVLTHLESLDDPASWEDEHLDRK